MTRRLARILTVVVAAAGLLSGGVVAAAGPSSAASLQPPRVVTGLGSNLGYVLTWVAPQDPTGVVDYRAEIYRASDTTFASPVLAGQTYPHLQGRSYTAEFVGLTPGVRYVGAVVARYGVAGSSARALGNVDQAYAPIGTARSVTVKPGNGSLTVRWLPPVADAATGGIAGYTVAVAPDQFRVNGNQSKVATLAVSARSAVFRGLTNGTRYRVSVWVNTVALLGGSVTQRAATPIGAPAKPAKLTRTWRSGGKAKLTWKKSKSSAAAPVAGYYVYVNGKRVATVGKGTSSYLAKHLKKGKKYSFSVKARNAIGTSTSARLAGAKRP